MPAPDLDLERRLLPLGWACAALLLAASAALAAIPALDHVQTVGRVCGDAAAPHCGWCPAAIGLALSALAALSYAAAIARPEK